MPGRSKIVVLTVPMLSPASITKKVCRAAQEANLGQIVALPNNNVPKTIAWRDVPSPTSRVCYDESRRRAEEETPLIHGYITGRGNMCEQIPPWARNRKACADGRVYGRIVSHKSLKCAADKDQQLLAEWRQKSDEELVTSCTRWEDIMKIHMERHGISWQGSEFNCFHLGKNQDGKCEYVHVDGIVVFLHFPSLRITFKYECDDKGHKKYEQCDPQDQSNRMMDVRFFSPKGTIFVFFCGTSRWADTNEMDAARHKRTTAGRWLTSSPPWSKE